MLLKVKHSSLKDPRPSSRLLPFDSAAGGRVNLADRLEAKQLRAPFRAIVAAANFGYALFVIPFASAALVVYRFEVAAYSLVLGLPLAAFFAWWSRSLLRGEASIDALRELTNVNRVLHAMALPLAVLHVVKGSPFYTPREAGLMFAVIATAGLALVHARVVLAALKEPVHIKEPLRNEAGGRELSALDTPNPREQPCG